MDTMALLTQMSMGPNAASTGGRGIFHLNVVRDVRGDHERLAPLRLHLLLRRKEPLAPARQEADLGPLSGELANGGTTEPRRCSGDDHDFRLHPRAHGLKVLPPPWGARRWNLRPRWAMMDVHALAAERSLRRIGRGLSEDPGAGPQVRLGKVLDDAYGFRISKNAEALDTLDTKVAQDAIEVLLAALEIASGVGEGDAPRRPSRIQSLKPKEPK